MNRTSEGEPSSSSEPKRERYIGTRRSKSWWEPCFDPELEGNLRHSKWDFSNNTGPRRAWLNGEDLCEAASEGEVFKIEGATFESCNIQGTFEHNPSIMFDKCRFINCDFGFSVWRNTSFRSCTFDKCSISQTSFEGCELRDCTWKRIGFVGNKTLFIKSFVTNPSELINAGFSGTDPARWHEGKHRSYQKFRLEGSKAHVARTLLLSHQSVGDDETFYLNAKTHDLQKAKAALFRHYHSARYSEKFKEKIKFFTAGFWFLEYCLLWVMGSLNGWGGSLLRPLAWLIASIFAFGAFYRYIPLDPSPQFPWKMSFDIATLAGYGTHSKPDLPTILWVTEAAQLVTSIFLYSVFFSTAVSRLSRTR